VDFPELLRARDGGQTRLFSSQKARKLSTVSFNRRPKFALRPDSLIPPNCAACINGLRSTSCLAALCGNGRDVTRSTNHPGTLKSDDRSTAIVGISSMSPCNHGQNRAHVSDMSGTFGETENRAISLSWVVEQGGFELRTALRCVRERLDFEDPGTRLKRQIKSLRGVRLFHAGSQLQFRTIAVSHPLSLQRKYVR